MNEGISNKGELSGFCIDNDLIDSVVLLNQDLQDNSILLKRMDDLRHTALMTPAPKRQKLGLDDHLELLVDHKPVKFEDSHLSNISEALGHNNTFLPVMAQAITQVRSDGYELFNRLSLLESDVGDLPTRINGPPTCGSLFNH